MKNKIFDELKEKSLEDVYYYLYKNEPNKNSKLYDEWEYLKIIVYEELLIEEERPKQCEELIDEVVEFLKKQWKVRSDEKMNDKQIKILKKYFETTLLTSNYGKVLELEQWTDGGVDMIIYVDLSEKNIIEGLEEYLHNFDIDEEIDIYRQDKHYRDNFKITESVKDFEDWVLYVENVVKKLKEVEQ